MTRKHWVRQSNARKVTIFGKGPSPTWSKQNKDSWFLVAHTDPASLILSPPPKIPECTCGGGDCERSCSDGHGALNKKFCTKCSFTILDTYSDIKESMLNAKPVYVRSRYNPIGCCYVFPNLQDQTEIFLHPSTAQHTKRRQTPKYWIFFLLLMHLWSIQQTRETTCCHKERRFTCWCGAKM